MKKLTSHPPRYIVDNKGKPTEVILSVDVYNKLIEQHEDQYFTALAEHALAHDAEEYSEWDVAKKRILKKKN